MRMTEAPGAMGYYFPPEWHFHRSTWLSWPHNTDTWLGDIDAMFEGYTQFVKEIALSEPVNINVSDQSMKQGAIRSLEAAQVPTKNIRFYYHPTNDAWCRDHGPLFMKNAQGNKIVVNAKFNAWGGKYPPYDLDNEIPMKVATALRLPYYDLEMILEGGSVEFNGNGTVLTTDSCLLNSNRNPGLSRTAIEKVLKTVFGVQQVLWLPHGLVGDDTDGHIDTITRFVSPDTVVTVVSEDPNDENHLPLRENLKALKAMKLWTGQSIKVVTLPMPRPMFHQHLRLPASYANFYICNQSVLVPTFNDPNDKQALSILSDLFKDRKVIGIDCSKIIRGLGALHCLCMQEPDSNGL